MRFSSICTELSTNLFTASISRQVELLRFSDSDQLPVTVCKLLLGTTRLQSVCKSLESQTDYVPKPSLAGITYPPKPISDALAYASKSHKSDSCKSAPLIFKSFTDCNQYLSSSTAAAVKATSEFQLALSKIQLYRFLCFNLTRDLTQPAWIHLSNDTSYKPVSK